MGNQREIYLVLLMAGYAATVGCDSVKSMNDCGFDLTSGGAEPEVIEKYPMNGDSLENGLVFSERGLVAVSGNDQGDLYAVSDDCRVRMYKDGSWETIPLSGAPSEGQELYCMDAFVPSGFNGVWTVGTTEDAYIPASFASLQYSGVENEAPGQASAFVFIAQSDPQAPCLDSYVDQTSEHQHGAWLESVTELDDGSVLLVGGWALGAEQPDPDYSSQNWHNDMLRNHKTRGLVSFCEYMNGGENFTCSGIEYHPQIPFSDGYGVSKFDFYLVGNSFESTDGEMKVTGSIYRCNGCECHMEFQVKGSFLNAIWGTSMNDVFVVGGFANSDGGQKASVLLYKDEHGWKEVELETDIPLNDVWGTSSFNVYVVGGHQPETGTPEGLTLHYDGSGWNTVDTGTSDPINGVYLRNGGKTWLATSEGLVAL